MGRQKAEGYGSWWLAREPYRSGDTRCKRDKNCRKLEGERMSKGGGHLKEMRIEVQFTLLVESKEIRRPIFPVWPLCSL